MAVAAHDHTIMNGSLPDGGRNRTPFWLCRKGDDRDGVECIVERGTDCPLHPLVCPCLGTTARLRTRIAGSRMADGITEHAFSVEMVQRALTRFRERHQTRAVQMRRFLPLPWHANNDTLHWLLRSLTLLLIVPVP